MKWSITYSYLSSSPREVEATDIDDLFSQMQAIADAKQGMPIGKLEFEESTDDVRAFFVHKGLRVRFMNAQYVG